MTLKFLRHRLGRILSRPPEVLFAITRHPILILIVIALGGGYAVMKVRSEPVVYEGNAQLVVNQSDSLLRHLAPSATGIGTDFDVFRRFMEAQTRVIGSDTVHQKMLLILEGEGFELRPTATEDDDSIARKIRSSISSAKSSIREMLQIESPPPQASERERLIFNEIRAFKLRSLVNHEPNSNTIGLTVYGSDRLRIDRELHTWMAAYVERTKEMAQERYGELMDARTQLYDRMAREASTALTSFKEAHPDVSIYQLEFVDEQIARLQIRRDDLRRELEFGDLVDRLRPRESEDDELQRLRGELNDAEVELAQLRASGHTDESTKVVKLKDRIAGIREVLPKAGNPLGFGDPEEAKKKIKEQLDNLTTELTGLLKKKARLREQTDTLEELVTKHRSAVQQQERFQMTLQESRDLMETNKLVSVDVVEQPVVSTEPFEYRPFRMVAVVSTASLLVGMILAILLEVVYGKVRFKNDIIEDFGLPVIGVFPK